MSAAPPLATLDHLVVLATSLASGVAWAEATLGVTPGPGGEHPLMGTHNRLLRLLNGRGQPGAAYLEIIAINPAATPTLQPPEHRWFDMDDLALRERLNEGGVKNVLVVRGTRDGKTLWRVRIGPMASVDDYDAVVDQLEGLGIRDISLARAAWAQPSAAMPSTWLENSFARALAAVPRMARPRIP